MKTWSTRAEDAPTEGQPWADVSDGDVFGAPTYSGLPCEGEWSDWMCTRPRDHEPPHAAWGSSLYAMWEDES